MLASRTTVRCWACLCTGKSGREVNHPDEREEGGGYQTELVHVGIQTRVHATA